MRHNKAMSFLNRYSYLLASKFAHWLIKLCLTLAAFAFIFHSVEIAHIAEILKTQEYDFLGEAVILLLAQFILGALRWHMILRAIADDGAPPLTLLPAIKLYYISIFFNNCLPGTVGGDVVRVWLAKAQHMSLSIAIHSVVIDRLIALLALGLLVLITLPFMAHMLGVDPWLVWLAVIIVAVLGLLGLYAIHVICKRLPNWRLAQWIGYFLASLKMLWVRPFMSLSSLAYAMVAHGCFSLCCYVLAQSLHIDLSLSDALTLMPLVLLISIMPLSIGGWGVREVGMVGMLALAGVPAAQATLMGIEIGLLNIILTLPAGILWLIQRKEKTP